MILGCKGFGRACRLRSPFEWRGHNCHLLKTKSVFDTKNRVANEKKSAANPHQGRQTASTGSRDVFWKALRTDFKNQPNNVTELATFEHLIYGGTSVSECTRLRRNGVSGRRVWWFREIRSACQSPATKVAWNWGQMLRWTSPSALHQISTLAADRPHLQWNAYEITGMQKREEVRVCSFLFGPHALTLPWHVTDVSRNLSLSISTSALGMSYT